MDRGPAFVADVETPVAMQPRDRAFHDPAGTAESTAVWTPPSRDLGADAATMKFVAVASGVVGAIPLDQDGPPAGPPGSPGQGGEGVHEWEELSDIGAVGGRHEGDHGDAAGIGQKVMFRSLLAAIGWVRSSFFPPRNARRDALSTMARLRSS